MLPSAHDLQAERHPSSSRTRCIEGRQVYTCCTSVSLAVQVQIKDNKGIIISYTPMKCNIYVTLYVIIMLLTSIKVERHSSDSQGCCLCHGRQRRPQRGPATAAGLSPREEERAASQGGRGGR